MDIFCIRGGTPLHGRIALHGAKNAALPLLAATLGGASLCGIEEEIGTLDIGKEADLIAFERDPLTAAPRELVPAWVIRSGKVMKNPVGVCS